MNRYLNALFNWKLMKIVDEYFGFQCIKWVYFAANPYFNNSDIFCSFILLNQFGSTFINEMNSDMDE